MKANTPNPTPTTLRDLTSDALHQIRTRALRDAPIYLQHVSSAESQLNQSIQEQLKALLPEKKYVSKYTPQNKVPMGFNQAIDQIQKAIEDFCSGKGKE